MNAPIRRVVRRMLPEPVATFIRDNLPDLPTAARSVSASNAGEPAASNSNGKSAQAQPSRPAERADVAGAAATVTAGEAGELAASLRDEPASAVADTVRGLLDEKKHSVAEAVGAALGGRHGALAAGIVAGVRGFDDRAWWLLQDQLPQVWSVHAPSEYVRAGMVCDRDRTVASIWALVEQATWTIPAKSWLDLLGPVYAHGEFELAQALFERLDSAVGDGSGIDGSVRWPRDWFRDWVNRPGNAPSATKREGAAASFAILDYRHPDRFRASANIGDHVQSLAAISHVVRHQNLTFTGAEDLADLAGRLQQRVRPELQRTDRTGTVDLYLAQRDASNHDSFPEDTWAIGFGWYMHPQFGINYDFPFHPNLRPIFVSFHVNSRQMITPAAVEYLKRYGPVGCRDWTTVDLLLSAGVDAFFSGCMTTTVSNVFPDTDVRPPSDAPTAYIDVPAHKVPQGALTAGQARDAVRLTPFAENLDFAVAMLETYRREYADITTSRLHVYLPSRSIGVKVNFTPENMSDPRFAGLAPIDDRAFDAIRDGINLKLEQVMGAALSGAPVDDVYDLWRRLTADDVAAAKRRLGQPVTVPAAQTDLPDLVAQSRPTKPAESDGDTINVAIRATASHTRLLRVLLSSITAHTSRPVHARIVTRSPNSFRADELEREVPGVRISVVDTTVYGRHLDRADGGRHSAQEVDRFITADLFPEVDRLIVLPVGAVVTADISELADLDLGDQVLAAPRTWSSRHTSGYAVLLGAARRLQEQVDRSAEFRRIMHQRHAYDFERFETEVLVIDLPKWRDGGLLSTCIAWSENFGLTHREALHAEFGPNTVALPARWHVVPTQSAVTEQALVHWAEKPWPWGDGPAPLREVWQGAQQDMRDSVPAS